MASKLSSCLILTYSNILKSCMGILVNMTSLRELRLTICKMNQHRVQHLIWLLHGFIKTIVKVYLIYGPRVIYMKHSNSISKGLYCYNIRKILSVLKPIQVEVKNAENANTTSHILKFTTFENLYI